MGNGDNDGGWDPADIRKIGEGIYVRRDPIVDPTKNVLDLVHAESKYQDSMRGAIEKCLSALQHAESRYQDSMRETESRMQNWMRDAQDMRIAEKDKRVAETTELRQTYELRIARMLADSVKSTSDVVSAQLVQIQNTFNDRVAKLEQFRWESGGKTSVADPQTADALSKMAASIITLTARSSKTEGREVGRHDVVGWIAGGIGIAVGVASLLGVLLTHGTAVHLG